MEQKLLHIKAWPDGACSKNPGVGGYGVVLTDIHDQVICQSSGTAIFTTNNRMELMACIVAVKLAFQEYGADVLTVYTDSIYVKMGITVWIKKWQLNQWVTANKNIVKNCDLWQELNQLNENYLVNWEWVKGHGNHHLNNLADKLACTAITNLCKMIKSSVE